MHPDKPIYSDFDGSNEVTYSGIRSAAAKCSYSLRHKLGLKEGDTVCVFGKNTVNWLVLVHSLLHAGCVFRSFLATLAFADNELKDT